MPSILKPLALLICFSTLAARAQQPLKDCRQLLVVTTESWTAPQGEMSIFERDHESLWQRRGPAFDVRVGRSGLALGRGLFDTTSVRGPHKREGDDKAPAGIFRLGLVFGSKPDTKMPFVKLSPEIVAVDDPRSRYYNRFVDTSKINNIDWRHAEKIFGVDVYRRGILVQQNLPPKPGAGSCIFIHIWKTPETSTSGCTAMSERNLINIIRWLDPKRKPLLVQLPRSIYNSLRAKWSLPTL